jgi:tRNA threonylcarbamoyladenosine biosynthesis protein TsaE
VTTAWRRRSSSAFETESAGQSLARLLRPGDVVLLTGPLGAGKTTFARGVGKGLGVRDRVTSPTFTLVREHDCANDLGIARLQHADLYRLSGPAEALDLAIGELVEESAVALVEWGDLAAPVFGREVLTVDLAVAGDEERVITVSGALAEARRAQLGAWGA